MNSLKPSLYKLLISLKAVLFLFSTRSFDINRIDICDPTFSLELSALINQKTSLPFILLFFPFLFPLSFSSVIATLLLFFLLLSLCLIWSFGLFFFFFFIEN